ncbi:hypothetical protein [Micromonospora echinaurantiaca]|uniref:hypothetical protein n=1 Tax=Micromonospora echinaurantiaca TaxID=47857 RepID=UPI00379AE002
MSLPIFALVLTVTGVVGQRGAYRRTGTPENASGAFVGPSRWPFAAAAAADRRVAEDGRRRP